MVRGGGGVGRDAATDEVVADAKPESAAAAACAATRSGILRFCG